MKYTNLHGVAHLGVKGIPFGIGDSEGFVEFW
jgi:hypothetical protein